MFSNYSQADRSGTPLHGILGATQLLNDTGLNSMQSALIGTITSCGSTLHETLTSFLSYAKINQFERRQHKYRQRRPPDSLWALPDKNLSSSGPDRDYEGLYIGTNVAKLCEESLSVLEAGASSDRSSEAGNVIVVYDVEYEDNWSFYTEPGALRRIMINLIGNALKYTSKGSIRVSLAAPRVIQDEHTISNDLDAGRTITLTIEDTGKGMSKAFMENQLFVPFTQEDATSSQGVGLGMSIVKSLVSLFSGKIEAKSEVGTGTKIIVRIPTRLCRSNDEKGQPTVDLERDVEFLRSRKLLVVIFGFPDLVRASLERYLRDWFSCTILEATRDAKPNIVLVDEGNDEVSDAVNETAQAYGQSAVLLSIVMSFGRLANHMNTINGYRNLERVPRPLGPHSIAKGLLACVAKLDNFTNHSDRDEGDDVAGGTSAAKTSAGAEQKSSDEGSMSAKAQLQLLDDFGKLEIAPRILRAAAEESHQTGTTEQARQPPASKPSPKSTSSEVSSKLCFLVVDDNPLNLRLLRAFLKKSGHRDIKEAVNGAIAVEAVVGRLECFDIIFMGMFSPAYSVVVRTLTQSTDLSMPVMDGFAATRRIRDIEKERGYREPAQTAVIVALTGLASEKDEKEAFGAGVDIFMTKPVQFGELSKLVKRCENGTFQRKISPVEADEK
jgi:CheY-like chemotaxis protein